MNIGAEQLNLKDGEEHKGETLYPQINKATLCSHSQTTIATSETPSDVVYWQEGHNSPIKQDTRHGDFDM